MESKPTKWLLSLDESGVINGSDRYFILAGILYKEEHFKEVKDYFVPLVEKICNIIEVEELHSSKLGKKKKDFVRNVIFSHIGYFKHVKPIIYIIDKKHTTILKSYSKKSWKYNKAIEFFIKDLVENKKIDENDKVGILIDNIDLNYDEEINFRNWLPDNVEQIDFIIKGESKDFKFIQLADIVANSCSKNKSINLKDFHYQILDPFVELFPKQHKKDYIK